MYNVYSYYTYCAPTPVLVQFDDGRVFHSNDILYRLTIDVRDFKMVKYALSGQFK